MESTENPYVVHLLTHLLAFGTDPGVRRRLSDVDQAVEALVEADLEPVRSMLLEGYSDGTRGHPPRDPVAMLRCVVLMALCHGHRINSWVARLDREPELVVLSGFRPDQGRPGVGTLYDFLKRLFNGPFVRTCPHQVRPSDRFQGARHGFVRHLDQEKGARRAAGEAGKDRVQRAVDAQRRVRDEPLPRDFGHRLDTLLWVLGVVPSAKRGLLDPLGALDVAADGSLIPSQANGNGWAECSCPDTPGTPRCSCPRRYEDPDATWGWDAHRERYVFGYRVHAVLTPVGGVDFPLHVRVAGAHEPDAVLGVNAFAILSRRVEDQLEDVARIRTAIADAGYDATALYAFLGELGIRPVIPLHDDAPTPDDAQGYPRDAEGRPQCKGEVAMRLHQRLPDGELVYNCPVKRPGREKGKLVMRVHREECPLGALCEPDTKMGPLVHLRPKDDPRMNLAVPRGSAEFKEQMAKRTCTERFFSLLKSSKGVGPRPYRRQYVLAVMVTLKAIVRHALAWVEARSGRGFRLLERLNEAAPAGTGPP